MGLFDCLKFYSLYSLVLASPGMGVRSSLPPPSQPPPPPPPAMMMMQMGDQNNQGSGVVMGNPANSSSLSRRAGGQNPGSVLGGAPPRIRDYSEYGIPTSVPGGGVMNQPPPPGVVAMASPAGTMNNNVANKPQLPPAPSQNVGGTGSLRYREGQA